MKLKIRQIGDPVLETVAEKVKDPTNKYVQKLIDNMIDTCRADINRTAGLSAPQVGESLAISICRRFDEGEDIDKWEVMINPEIVSESSKSTTVWEGCLSIGVGDKAIYGPVSRPKHITVGYLDRKGRKRSLDAKDYFSHVVQHEVDHVNGILFLKYVQNPDQNLWLSRDLDDYIERNEAFPPIA
ncbi:peptide deformylase [Candidatus Dojkabacteria bacterium]|nr:peptide deformylase [Candidatus Dojkabacteria bacterium]